MGRPRKNKEVESVGFSQEVANKIVASNKRLRDFNKVFVTSDRNIFYEEHEGSAYTHARKFGLEILTVNKEKENE